MAAMMVATVEGQPPLAARGAGGRTSPVRVSLTKPLFAAGFAFLAKLLDIVAEHGMFCVMTRSRPLKLGQDADQRQADGDDHGEDSRSDP